MKNNILNGMIIICLLSFPKINFGQAPNLGTAANFALFSSAGAFENYGATDVVGDIGTNVGAFSGFPPGTITGQIHVADPTSVQAALDTDAAYSDLDGLSCGVVIGTTLGNGQVLTPNIYCLGGASVLNGNLILDGQGDPNALFIIKIDNAFSTNALSSISLINETTFDHVFWQVNGAVELGDNSLFRGTIITNGAITLLENSTLYGRGLSRQGAIYVHNSSVNMLTDVIALPIELISFSAENFYENTLLKWSTLSEINNDYFTIESSTNGHDWNIIAQVDGKGNSNSKIQYSYIDQHPFIGIVYYRLKQTNFDGKFSYSNTLSLQLLKISSDELIAYPNPTNGLFNLNLNKKLTTFESIDVYSTTGQQIYSSTENKTTIDLSEQKNGLYFIHVNMNSEVNVLKLVLEKL